jgi:hypothetical protein
MMHRKTNGGPARRAALCPAFATFALATLPGMMLHTKAAHAADTPPRPLAAISPQERVERENWRQKVMHTPKPGKGCYAASFPDTKWHEVRCGKSNGKLYPPKRGGMSQTDVVGGAGPDFSALVTGTISQAEGSFDSVSGVTSESNSNGVANEYSLQLNTNQFTAKACSAAKDPSCTGWEQFVYDSSGSTQIQYWLINWGPAGTMCPAPNGASCSQGSVSSDGWCPQTVSGFSDVLCVVDAANPPTASSVSAASLAQLTVTGTAGHGSTADSMVMAVGGTVTTGFGGNYFPDLGSKWTVSEFNVFGDSSDQANFNTGSTIEVRTSVASGAHTGPTCDEQSFTAESNNLILVATNDNPPKSVLPSLVFTESNANGSVQASCAEAVSLGDTHMTTFDGLHYDFQASGEFVLAQDGPDFIVQTRQASGAPTWPQAAVNKALSAKFGKARVALYIEPTRLVVDGVRRDLADGRRMRLSTGVQIARHGEQYLIAAENGDTVRATLNPTWIDVTVGLGRAASRNTRGLLGNPKGDAHALATADGAELREPVSFNDLYHKYADGWRVKQGESLFAEPTAIKPSAPSQPFFAKNLDPAAEARARAACTKAGVTHADLLEDCVLDRTVLNDEKATKVFIHPPLHILHVVKPVI